MVKKLSMQQSASLESMKLKAIQSQIETNSSDTYACQTCDANRYASINMKTICVRSDTRAGHQFYQKLHAFCHKQATASRIYASRKYLLRTICKTGHVCLHESSNQSIYDLSCTPFNLEAQLTP
jgi:hypothetical protein